MIYLASRSPRRRELLTQIGVRYHLLLYREKPRVPPDVDEAPLEGETPDAYVQRVARLKADVAWAHLLERRLPLAAVLAADTTVALGTRILGKPASRAEAEEMLASLSDTEHEVLTAIALRHGDWMESALSRSAVRFKRLSPEEIREYAASGECEDKAGAYAIQGRAGRFVVDLRGSYSGVMGLPLYETAELLAAHERRNPH
jgi:septum formation protein